MLKKMTLLSFFVLSMTFGISNAAAQTQPKIATIQSAAFLDQKNGISRFIAAMKTLDAEMKPRRDEIAQLAANYDLLVKQISDGKGILDEKTIAAKADKAEQLKIEIERKQQDGQKAFDRRYKEVTEPIFSDIETALDAFAKKRGVDVILDLSKSNGSVLWVNNAIDLTAAFVSEFNAKAVTP